VTLSVLIVTSRHWQTKIPLRRRGHRGCLATTRQLESCGPARIRLISQKMFPEAQEERLSADGLQAELHMGQFLA